MHKPAATPASAPAGRAAGEEGEKPQKASTDSQGWGYVGEREREGGGK
jgi:hypothetical protein